ncbi:uncharacterized protein SCHCODRAFT_02638947 [Schizophyllum commune H4-8]|uniref:uncharacterized protein n=1 Tax=Schizophyllum commune (strain H4-8 / FGSC 9210) TaxID=578458 RepID=UPI00215E3BBD|nr:uncharacterized protein SCHCODRAFT_02638947 [Schizophyllum commune H4-8]KAI5887775.1 hypothetical protein SCHCODRAFT_02638947 [Schizophyllum commune H4-8]
MFRWSVLAVACSVCRRLVLPCRRLVLAPPTSRWTERHSRASGTSCVPPAPPGLQLSRPSDSGLHQSRLSERTSPVQTSASALLTQVQLPKSRALLPYEYDRIPRRPHGYDRASERFWVGEPVPPGSEGR